MNTVSVWVPWEQSSGWVDARLWTAEHDFRPGVPRCRWSQSTLCPPSITLYVLSHDSETYSRIFTCQCSNVNLYNISVNQDMHCAYDVTVWRLPVTTVATERQHLVLSVLLSYTSLSTICLWMLNVAQQCSYHGTTSPATVKCKLHKNFCPILIEFGFSRHIWIKVSNI